jgi:signal transduction histidine kinase
MEGRTVEQFKVGELISSKESVPPGMRVDEVADQIFTARRLEAVALVENGVIYGLATRNKVFGILFRRFGFELYGRDPILAIADRNPLIVSADEILEIAVEKAMHRNPADIYDEIVVVDAQGLYLGLLSIRGLVMAQGDALSHSLLQRERAFVKAQEMQKVSDIKSQFIDHVTHELRSPANVVLGVAELMRESLIKGNHEELNKLLALLAAGATSLRSVITNILDMSKIEAGKMQVIVESCELLPLLEEVAEMTRVLLAGAPVSVQVLVEDPTLTIASDFVKLRQILINLTSNAAKFTRAGTILLRLSRQGAGVRLSVEDTGVGIREEDLEKLFQAFSQLEDTKTRHSDGTGLGLTITRQLVDLLGGTIKVTSIYGQGSIFSVDLPEQIQPMECLP